MKILIYMMAVLALIGCSSESESSNTLVSKDSQATRSTSTSTTNLEQSVDSTDWTPHLTGIQDSCKGVFNIMDELPYKYEDSIADKYDNSVKETDGSNNITTTYQLKDAIFFGLDLDKIQEEYNDSYPHYLKLSLVFKDEDFMKLRPSFYYTARSEEGFEYIINQDNPVVDTYQNDNWGMYVKYENTDTGYNVNDEGDVMSCSTTLDFDESNSSLSCAVVCG